MLRAAATPHEKEIVRLVEDLARQGRLEPDAVADIACLLNFIVTESEATFLVEYILWRTDPERSSEE